MSASAMQGGHKKTVKHYTQLQLCKHSCMWLRLESHAPKTPYEAPG